MELCLLPKKFQSERLLYRPYKFEDIDQILKYAADLEWARYLPVPVPYTRADAEKFVASQLLLEWEKNPAWALEYQGESIGGINIRLVPAHALAEVGYSIARPLWGKGLASEALQTMLDLAFRSDGNLNRVRAMADARNVGSTRVMEKCGMSREGVLRQNQQLRGKLFDEAWYGILRLEWEAKGK